MLGERVDAVIYAPDLQSLDPQAHQATVAAIREHCKTHLADYKVPESIHFYPQALPRNANGKLLKRELKLALKS
ncbi:MAG: hypothetical protein EBW20_08735 [Betaproteobacteria bacterium]|nr:hypothetical protein [Betaproteobacteria bacterium]NDH30528.1 hypothetical protein [Betaproteobacteria bacterium]